MTGTLAMGMVMAAEISNNGAIDVDVAVLLAGEMERAQLAVEDTGQLTGLCHFLTGDFYTLFTMTCHLICLLSSYLGTNSCIIFGN